jgi:uncharacterized protein YaaQ
MKMIVVNTEDSISGDLSRELINHDFRVTNLSATGGFFRGGITTLMIGIQDHLLEDALTLIKEKTKNHPDYKKECTTIYVLNSTFINTVRSGESL